MFMNGNKIDSVFSISFLVIAKHFAVSFTITFFDKVPESIYSGTALFCYVNIIVDWAVAVAYSCPFDSYGKQTSFSFTLLFLDQVSFRTFIFIQLEQALNSQLHR